MNRKFVGASVVVALLVFGATAVASVAAASTGSTATSAGDFLKSYYVLQGHGQYGRAWDRLHPAQQRFISSDRFIDCADRALPSFEVERWKVLDTYPEKVGIPGTRSRVWTTAVTMRYTLGIGGRDATETTTLHAILVNGKWRWVFSAAHIAKIKLGKCWS